MKVMDKILCLIRWAGKILLGGAVFLAMTLMILRACGWKLLAVQTGSMGDVYPVGTLILVTDDPPDSVAEGDVISFVANESLFVVTHRVVRNDKQHECFYTKGDSNNVIDSNPVVYENYLGRVAHGIPWVGYVVIFANTGKVKYICICLIAAAVLWEAGQLIWFLLKKIQKRRLGADEDEENAFEDVDEE